MKNPKAGKKGFKYISAVFVSKWSDIASEFNKVYNSV